MFCEPHETLTKRSFQATNDYGIVLITSNSLRHEHFAYAIQNAFPDLVQAWFKIASVSRTV